MFFGGSGGAFSRPRRYRSGQAGTLLLLIMKFAGGVEDWFDRVCSVYNHAEKKQRGENRANDAFLLWGFWGGCDGSRPPHNRSLTRRRCPRVQRARCRDDGLLFASEATARSISRNHRRRR